jgi:predicted HD phosphohydrolase
MTVSPQENTDVRPLREYEAPAGPVEDQGDAVRAALAWHDGDAQATIATLLADCAHLRRQLDLTRAAMGHGFVRCWEPMPHRD